MCPPSNPPPPPSSKRLPKVHDFTETESVTSVAHIQHDDAHGLLPLLANLGGDDPGDGEETHAHSLKSLGLVEEELADEPPADSGLAPDSRIRDGVNATLEVIGGPAKGKVFRFSHVATVVGRTNASITIADPTISRRQAVITFQGDHFRIRDEGGRNATYLNGARLKAYSLRDGDTLVMGQTMLLFRVFDI